MNAIRRAAFAASALVITLVGAVCVTAPMAFAGAQTGVARQACSIPSLERHATCGSARSEAWLVAFNRV